MAQRQWQDLRTAVAARYAQLGPPSWADPHPDGAEARDEEYSRLTEPERYAVVHARARVWAEVLADVLGAEGESLSARAMSAGHFSSSEIDRGIQITPQREELRGPVDPHPHRGDRLPLPLLLLERDGPPASLHIAAGRAENVLLRVPDCGCDACDRGSDDLLDAIDETVGMVVGAPLVVLRGSGWDAYWSATGVSSAHNTDLDWVMDVGPRLAGGEDVRLAHGVEAFVGQPWI